MCALASDHRMKCAGLNISGDLGLGDTATRGDSPGEMGNNLPVIDFGTGKTVSQIATGEPRCAILNDTSLKCWGPWGGWGDPLNRGDQPDEMGDNLPAIDLGTGKYAVQISIAGSRCALLNDNTIKCWGAGSNGQLGNGATQEIGDDPGEMGDNQPAVDLGSGLVPVHVASGGLHHCVLFSGGGVKCWGYNHNGQLGLGDTSDRGDSLGEMGDNLPLVNLGQPVTALGLGSAHSCALLSNGTVKCWGLGQYGQLGQSSGNTANMGDEPDEMSSLAAINLGTGKTAVAIAVGGHHTCAILNDGSVKCWGSNNYGQLGLGDTTNRGVDLNQMGDNLPAINLGTGKTAVGIAAGFGTTCALLNDGKVKCWGKNDGNLGLGDLNHRGDQPGEMGDNLPYVEFF